jgi:hypothetical protein
MGLRNTEFFHIAIAALLWDKSLQPFMGHKRYRLVIEKDYEANLGEG